MVQDFLLSRTVILSDQNQNSLNEIILANSGSERRSAVQVIVCHHWHGKKQCDAEMDARGSKYLKEIVLSVYTPIHRNIILLYIIFVMYIESCSLFNHHSFCFMSHNHWSEPPSIRLKKIVEIYCFINLWHLTKNPELCNRVMGKQICVRFQTMKFRAMVY